MFTIDYRAEAQQQRNDTRLRFTDLKEIRNAVLLAIAPDCGRICLWFSKKPIGRLTLRASGDHRTVGHSPPDSGILAVVEIGTWREIVSITLAQEPVSFSFFLGGDALYGVTEPAPFREKLSGRVAMVVNLVNGQIERLPAPFTTQTPSYFAVRDHILIGVRSDELLRAEWPSLHEFATVATGGRTSRGLNFSGDREQFIQVVDQRLLCRRTLDFGVFWTRDIDSSIDMSLTANGRGVPGPSLSVAEFCFSADGNTVALGARRVDKIATPVEFYVEVLNAKDGTPLVRWHKNPGHGLALSPDGSQLAIAELAEAAAGLEATVHIYEVPSGKEIATLVHDRVDRSRRLGVKMSREFGFTDDGNYFVTANSNKTKVWKIERS